jgi:hypothetical protein
MANIRWYLAQFKAWLVQNRILLVMILALLLIIVGMALTAPKAQALDLNSAWRIRIMVLPAAGNDTINLSPLNGSVMSLPNAYMVWSKSGAACGIRRFFDGARETHWIGIPEGQSLVIPAPMGRNIAGTWTHEIGFSGTAADTILYLPMDR